MEHPKTIEIFVCCEIGQVVDWLNLVAGPVVLVPTRGHAEIPLARHGTGRWTGEDAQRSVARLTSGQQKRWSETRRAQPSFFGSSGP